MASRYDIIHIDFQVNAGKANIPLQSIQAEAKKTRDTIVALDKQLKDGKAAGMAAEKIGELEAKLKEARSALGQFDKAEKDLIKGVGTLDKAIKSFNDGTLGKMSAAFQKAAINAANLAKTKLAPDSATYKKDLAELNALIQKASENLAKARLSTNDLVSTIQKGGNVSKQALTQEVQSLQELLALLPHRSKEYDKYAKSLSTVKAKLDEVTAAEQLAATRSAGRATLKKAQDGGFATASANEINAAIAKLKEYQTAIRDPKGLGKKQFEKTTMAIKKLETQLQSMKTISKETMAVLNSPKGKSFNELKAAIDEARAKLNTMRQTTEREKQAYDQLAASIKQADIQMKSLAGSAKGTATSFDKAWSRLKMYIGLYMGAAVAIQKLVATMGDLMELSDKMGEVRKTTGFTAQEVGNLSRSLAKLDTRTPIQGLMELSAVAGQLGLKTEDDVRGFTEAANMLMVALPELGKEGATAMLKVALATGEIDKIRKQLQEGTIEGSDAVSVAMTKIGSTIDALRANSAAAAPAITDFVKRVGAVGAQSGISIDQIAALGSTVDALGMRVEMSATALSRMLPAIRNNAFDLAKAIGVTPETIRNLYDTGRGMEAVLMILQHIKDSGADAESIETMLGRGGMADVMKDLNQQGARAGIVFAGLSQNVDELRRQLVVAETAYEDNVAIINEYNKMNETTAAKWARLKNMFEELFVSDSSQRFFGVIIDGLRGIVYMISGPMNGAFTTMILSFAAFRLGLGEALVSLGRFFLNIGENIKKLIVWIKALNTANLWVAGITAAVTAVTMLVKWLNSARNAAGEVTKALSEAEAQFSSTERAVGDLFHRLRETTVKTEETTKKIKELKQAEHDLQEELEILHRDLGEGAEQTEKYRKKQEELEEAHKKVTAAEGEAAHQTERRMGLIAEINSKYSEYLGYMLSEASTAETVASAHNLIIASLKEEMYWREQNSAFENVRKRHEENLSEYRSDSLEELDYLSTMQQQNIMSDWQRVLSSIQYNNQKAAYEYNGKFYEEQESLLTDLKETLFNVLKNNNALNVSVGGRTKLNDIWGRMDDGFKDWSRESLDVLKETGLQQTLAASAATEAHKQTIEQAKANIDSLKEQAQKSDATTKQIAEAAVGITKNIQKYSDLNGYFGGEGSLYTLKESERNLEGVIRKLFGVGLSETKFKAIIAEAEKLFADRTLPTTPTSPKSPWGTPPPAESSSYADMDADALVARRKQMNKFVRAIQTDTDVNAVLKEDAQLRKAIENGMSSDMRTVVEWYNTERLKIQDELHGRHLTNTGDWLDPKKAKGRKKQLHDEWRAYLEELDAYYTERKTRIQEAGTEEGITEAEVRNRTLANEMEWRQRRAELQKLYADKGAEVTRDEQEAIFAIIAERTEDSSEMVEKTIRKTVQFMQKIGEKSPVELEEALAKLGLGWERDFLKQQQAVTQQMKAIQDIIDKERPFNGITKNLRENLVTMGILTADMTEERNKLMTQGEDMSDFNARQANEEMKRTAFLLKEAETVYTSTVEDVMRRMGEAGMQAWADEISKSDAMKQALMAQLRTAYDDVQNAIKKEATLIRRQTDIWWSDIAVGQTQSRRDGFEQMLSRLGLQADQVKRANQLISAGAASERVADKLAIKQMQVQLAMQTTYYNRMRQIGEERIRQLEAEGKLEDAEHLRRSLNLAKTEELKKLEEQRVAIANQMEESQNRLYQSMREWADLLSSSLRSLFEASNAGNEKFYNERAKLQLTGGTGEMQQIIVIDNAGTSSAKAHYETHDEMGLLQREREIEQQNAVADAWKKVMDDINQKMSDMITDQMNAMLQNASVDTNTDALGVNTKALNALTEAVLSGRGSSGSGGLTPPSMPGVTALEGSGENGDGTHASIDFDLYREGSPGYIPSDENVQFFDWQAAADTSTEATGIIVENAGKQAKAQGDANKKMAASTQSMYAKMTQAANLYGIAYQAMSNDNLSTAQKFEMIAVQAAGNAAISMLTADLSQNTGETAATLPAILAKCLKINPIAGAAIFAVLSALIGGLMGLAVSKVAKSKSEIASVTGANNSVASGRLSTGMLTYAEGNVNEFTDPGSLTPGRSYNVDGADGKTYRAKYTGRNPQTHITNGPEFHLAGEDGKEAIIDARTTRLMQMDDTGIWRAIQVLYNGGSLQSLQRRRRGRGIPAFAGGNLDDFDSLVESDDIAASGAGASQEQMVAFQQSLDRNSAVLERALAEGIRGVFDVYGKGGLIDSYDSGKKTATRYGQRY